MTKTYSRVNLFQFIQTSFKKNKSDFAYFNLDNWDKIYVEVNVLNKFTYVYIVKNDVSKLKGNITLLLWLKIYDIDEINNFCNRVEISLKSIIGVKKSIVDDVIYCDYKFNDVSEIDFDSINKERW